MRYRRQTRCLHASNHDHDKVTGNKNGGEDDAACIRRLMVQVLIYLATAAFFVLGAFVFCVCCQY